MSNWFDGFDPLVWDYNIRVDEYGDKHTISVIIDNGYTLQRIERFTYIGPLTTLREVRKAMGNFKPAVPYEVFYFEKHDAFIASEALKAFGHKTQIVDHPSGYTVRALKCLEI